MRFSCKILIGDEQDESVVGEGRVKLLCLIKRHGSIARAAEELGMSYRTAWGKIKGAEKALGFKLLESHSGGNRGGGTELTPQGAEFLSRFLVFEKQLKETAQELFHEVFPHGNSSR